MPTLTPLCSPNQARRGLLRLAPALTLLLSGALVACDRAPSQPSGPGVGGMPPAIVAVEKVSIATLPASYEYVGQTAGARDVEVRARVGGILLKRNFVEGGVVQAGQSLYSLDSAPFQVALDRANADLASAQAKLAQATRNLTRAKSLLDARFVTQREVDDALSAEQIAQADVQGAQSRKAEAALNLGYTRVPAPIAGQVGRSQVSEGTLISGAQVLLATVTQTDPIKLRFGIADTDQQRWRAQVAAGQLLLPAKMAFDVELLLGDGSVYPRKGKVVFSDTRVSNSSGTVEAEAQVPNPQGQLKPGQFIRARLLGATRPNAVKVPTRAVLQGPQGKFVYVMADGKALPKAVEVGEQLSDGWIITQGLASGDLVIVDGMARIFFPGAPVQLAASAPQAPSSAPAGASAQAK